MNGAPHLAATADREEALRALVGASHVRSVEGSDSKPAAQLFVEPQGAQEISAVLKYANDCGLSVIPQGGSTKSNWGNPPSRSDLLLSTARLDQVVEHAWADLTVTVQAGCTIANLQHTLAQHGQRLALDPLWPDRATLGGVISTNDSGVLRLRFGSIRDLIIGITLALPDGTLASSGGKVVKNVAGYDLPKLATGAIGSLGVITQAIFRLHPLPQYQRTLTIHCNNLDELHRLLLQVQDSRLAHAALQTRFDAQSTVYSLDILFEGTLPGISAQEGLLQKLAAPAELEEGTQQVWQARQELWSVRSAAIAKFNVLPTEITRAIQRFRQTGSSYSCQVAAVIQATGLGYLRLQSTDAANLHLALMQLRAPLEQQGASLVILSYPSEMPPVDAWGTPGDSQALMAAIKHQFDPNRILNPGRFVGGL